MAKATSATFVGIHNEREFYSDHYLAEILTKDLRATVKRWRAAEASSGPDSPRPDQQLRSLGSHYRTFRAEFDRLGVATSERIKLQETWHRRQLEALGYVWGPGNELVEDEIEVPVLVTLAGPLGQRLVALGAYDADAEDVDPLTLKPDADQFLGEAPPEAVLLSETWDEIITRRIFRQDRAPRWVLLLSCGQTLLIERGKWAQNRLLRFDWGEILGRRELPTLQATAALLLRESLIPDSGTSLADELDENSHRHAFGVSGDLKYALREAIELLGNEVLRSRRDTGKEPLDEGPDFAEKLTLECLRYMYRLLFLFYIEARPELGFAPIRAEAYRKGYSLERLRDMELARLSSGAALDRNHIQGKPHAAVFPSTRGVQSQASHAGRTAYGKGALGPYVRDALA